MMTIPLEYTRLGEPVTPRAWGLMIVSVGSAAIALAGVGMLGIFGLIQLGAKSQSIWQRLDEGVLGVLGCIAMSGVCIGGIVGLVLGIWTAILAIGRKWRGLLWWGIGSAMISGAVLGALILWG